MAEVTELVTVFKFKGDINKAQGAADAMKDIGDNSAVAEKRVDGASEAFLGMSKNALAGLASVTALAAAIGKATEGIFRLGQATAELKGLGIDPVIFRETEDLFSRLGAADGDAANFVKKVAEAQNQLSLGLSAPFARSLEEQFAVDIKGGDTVADVLGRLREATDEQGFTAGQISVKAGELGFSPEFSKVLLATNQQFAEATQAIQHLAKSDRAMLEQSELVTQELKNLEQGAKRLFERFSLGLVPILRVLIKILDMIVDAWSRFLNFLDEKLEPVFTEMFIIIDKYVIPVFDKMVKFLTNVFLKSFEAVGKAFDFFVDIFNKHVLPVVQKMVDVFFDIIDAIRKAISKIPFVGSGATFQPIERPSFAQGVSSSNNNVNNSQSTTNINISGLNPEQIGELIRKAQQKQSSIASGAW